MIIFLCILLAPSTIIGAELTLWDEIVNYKQMTRENPSVSQDNSLGARTLINADRCLDTPRTFCIQGFCGTPETRAEALADYINNQRLTLGGQTLANNHQMVAVFQSNQSSTINQYTDDRASSCQEEHALATGWGLLTMLAPNCLTCAISATCALFWCAASEQ